MSKWLNVDVKKLAAYLDLLTPHVYEQAICTHKPLPLKQLMDRYDLTKNLEVLSPEYEFLSWVYGVPVRVLPPE